jgi:carbon storage regulator
MLVLSRKVGERIVIGENIVVTVVDVRGDRIRLGISAPEGVPIHREEVFVRLQEQARPATAAGPKPPRDVAQCA